MDAKSSKGLDGHPAGSGLKDAYRKSVQEFSRYKGFRELTPFNPQIEASASNQILRRDSISQTQIANQLIELNSKERTRAKARQQILRQLRAAH